MKRLITADAYKWVFDRAEHIRENNPDMDESESYGIAWKQYKKEHPSWKSKREKEKLKRKKKKKASLETEALENLQNDNDAIYSNIKDYIEKIETSLHNITTLDDFLSEEEYLMDNLQDIQDDAAAISASGAEAKGNGIDNEKSLYDGKNAIKNLEDELEELQEQLEEVKAEHQDLETEIDEIQSQIDDIQNQIANYQPDESVARLDKRLVRYEGRHRYICNAHDAIREGADDISDEVVSSRSSIQEAIGSDEMEEDINMTIADIIQELNSFVTMRLGSIEDDLQEAMDMNGRMGKGISDKESRIEELTEEIEQATSDLDAHNDKSSDLRTELNNLKSMLASVESELANM